VAVAVLAVAGALALPGIARRVLADRLSAATGRPVTVGGLELSPHRGRVVLTNLQVADRGGGALLTLERLDAQFSRRALLRGQVHITDAALQGLTVRIVRTGPGDFNVSDLLAGGGGGDTSALTIDRVALVGGAAVIEDRTLAPPRTWRVSLELHAQDVSSVAGAPPGKAAVSALVEGAPVSLSIEDLRLSPLQFRAALTARDIDASLAGLYVPADSPLRPGRGTVSVSATAEHAASTGLLAGLTAQVAGLELYRVGQEGPYLAAPAVQVTLDGLRVRGGGVALDRLAVDGGAAVLDDTRLAPARRWSVDGVALEARNLASARDAPPGVITARAATAGARVEVWGSNVRLAPLELDATVIVRNVDLDLFRLYLPPDLPVRPERGVVNATVRATHDERRGTRLALDAHLDGVELRRPGHFVLAPSLRVTADDIAFDAGAITVGQVRVAGDRLTLEERSVSPVRRWAVQNLAIEAKDLSSRRAADQGVASLRATVAGAAVSVWVTQARLDPLALRATAVLRGADAALLQLYLPAGVPVELGRGVVNATFQVGHSAVEGTHLTGDATFTGLAARGLGAFATLTVSAPSVRLTIADGRHRDGALSVGRIELSGSGSLADSRGAAARYAFSEFSIATESLTWPVSAPARVALSMRFQDRGQLEGSGTAQLTSPPPTISWAAELALKFRGVDLAPLGVYVPAAEGLGGRVRADVSATLAYGASLVARVRGDVGGARFAIAEGGQTLLSLRSIAATGLDLQWPDRLIVKQLRLRQPYARVERDRAGVYPLLARLAPRPAGGEATPSTAEAPAADGRRALPAMAAEEVIVEGGSAALVDVATAPQVRVDLPRIDLTLRDATWPASRPVALVLEAGLPAGGTLRAEGTASAEPDAVDLKLVLQGADLAPFQPYLGFPARVSGRADAALVVKGSLRPEPRLAVTGEAGLRRLVVSDGERRVLTTEDLRVTGIDAVWPDRLVLGRVHAKRSWASLERDAQGEFRFRTLFARPVSAPTGDRPASPAPASSPLAFSLREAILEDQAATLVDGVTAPPARIEVSGARLTVRDFDWPQRSAAKVELTSPMPAGGRLEVSGTFQIEPMRLDARAVLDGVAIEPAQAYLPIEGKVAGKVTGTLAVKLALEPLDLQVTGQARLQAFRLNDGDRAVVTVGRVDTDGIEVEWPKRVAFKSVQVRRPRILLERDEKGEIRLRELVTPRVAPAAASSSRGPPPAPASAAPSPPPALEVETLSLERALVRFVDHTMVPAYAEELEHVDVTFRPLTTVPGRPSRFTASGFLGGGSFKLSGEGEAGERQRLDVKLDLRDFILARANPYLARLTGWSATNGTLSATATYSLQGTRLDTRQDFNLRGPEVAQATGQDAVEERLGLPLDFLLSLMKDSRGDIQLSIPVSGDIATREFDFQEAAWGAVRNFAIRVLALPFSKVGSLFFSQDSKVQGVAFAPVVFEAGTARLAPAMDPHLQRVATFLRGAPAVKVMLEPVLVDADVKALKRERALAQLTPPPGASAVEGMLEGARARYRERWPDRPVPSTLDAIVAELATAEAIPPAATRDLATSRVEVVRQALASAGGVDPGRLGASARRAPLVEGAGAARVEFDLRPAPAAP
jgi:hypothetical protein